MPQTATDHLLANYTRIDRDSARRVLTPSLCSAQTAAVRRGYYRNQLQRGLPAPAVHRIPAMGSLVRDDRRVRRNVQHAPTVSVYASGPERSGA